MNRNALGILFVLGLACSSSPSSPGELRPTTIGVTSVTIEKVFWIVHSFPKQAVGDDDKTQTLSVGFQLKLSDDIEVDAIESAGFTNSGMAQRFDLSSGIDKERRLLPAHPQHFSGDLDPPNRGMVLIIGPHRFWIKLKNGVLIQRSFDLPAPGALESGGPGILFSEDLPERRKRRLEIQFPNAVSALQRPRIISFVKESDGFRLKFVVNDARFYSGGIIAVDAEGHWIANSEPFFSPSQNSILPIINEGKVLFTDEQENQVVFSATDLEFFEGYTMKDLAGIFILVTDGRQYDEANRTQAQFYEYDCQSSSFAVFWPPSAPSLP